jgi:serine/threonine protein kinase
VSSQAKDFIAKCLQLDSKDRMKAMDLIKHPWINPEALPPSPVATAADPILSPTTSSSKYNNNNNHNVSRRRSESFSTEDDDDDIIQHYDLSKNLPLIRHFYDRRISYISLSVSSNPVNFVKIGRYSEEKHVAVVNNKLSVLDMIAAGDSDNE